jgi:putative molybdopterin biosynthesis protein
MKPTQNLQSLDLFKTLGNPHRLNILRLLMTRPATLSQLGRALDLHPAKIRFHLKQLEGAGIVELTHSREVRGFVEKYYAATAQAYFINQVLLPEPASQGMVYALGSHDPALELVSKHLEGELMPDLVAIPVGSLDGLIALRQGFCHFTGCHLYDPIGGEYNTSYVRHLFPGQTMHVVTLAHREQGLLVSPGNPHHIQGLEDLGREGLSFVNRIQGSGTRLWMDQQMGTMGMDPSQVNGYDQEVSTHSQVAVAVQQGEADVGLGVLAAARSCNLDFVPLFVERFDLVIPDEFYRSDLLVPILDYLHTAEFRTSVLSLGGYDSQETGVETTLS